MTQLKSVAVSEFRDSAAHLERIFNVDRHACVGDGERENWAALARRILAMYAGLQCARAKPDDLARMDEIVRKITAYLAAREAETVAESAALDAEAPEAIAEQVDATLPKQPAFDVFVTNDTEVDGIKQRTRTKIGVGYATIDGEGVNIEILPGLSVSGSLVLMLAKPNDSCHH